MSQMILSLASFLALFIPGAIAGTNVINGTPQRDTLIGTDGPDLIKGYRGLDKILPGLGEDKILSGGGADRIFAADGYKDIIDPGYGYSSDRPGEGAEIIFVDSLDEVKLPTSNYKTQPTTITVDGVEYKGTYYKGGGEKKYKIFLVAPQDNPGPGSVVGDPHFVGYDGSKYDFNGYNGGVFNIFTETIHQINAQFVDYGRDVYEGTWMSGFGIRYRESFQLVAKLHLAEDFKPQQITDDNGEIRMVPPQDNFIVIEENGRVATEKLYSGISLELPDGVLLYYPPFTAKKDGEEWDGPILVIRTPDMEMTLLFETEGVLHLDLNVKLLSSSLRELHGVLGQSAGWMGAWHTEVEGNTEDYAVAEGLLASDFKFNLFKGTRETDKTQHRRLIEVAKPIAKYVGVSSYTC